PRILAHRAKRRLDVDASIEPDDLEFPPVLRAEPRPAVLRQSLAPRQRLGLRWTKLRNWLVPVLHDDPGPARGHPKIPAEVRLELGHINGLHGHIMRPSWSRCKDGPSTAPGTHLRI